MFLCTNWNYANKIVLVQNDNGKVICKDFWRLLLFDKMQCHFVSDLFSPFHKHIRTNNKIQSTSIRQDRHDKWTIWRQEVTKTYLTNREITPPFVMVQKYFLKTQEERVNSWSLHFRPIIISMFSVCTSTCKCVPIETKTNRFAFLSKK